MCKLYCHIKTIISLFLILANSFVCFPQDDWVQVTNNNSEDFHASFSPDGTKILFDSQQSGIYGIFLYDVLTKQTHQLTGNDVKCDHPTWFPDGKHILF